MSSEVHAGRTRCFREAGVSALACLVGLLTLPAVAPGEIPDAVGFNAVNQTQLPLDDVRAEDVAAAAAGADVIRVNVVWKDLQPDGPTSYKAEAVAKLDGIMREAAEHGLKVDAIVLHTPCWASSTPFKVLGGCLQNTDSDKYPPTRAADFGAFIDWLTGPHQEGTVRDYGDTLAAVEVWNEPNWGGMALKGPNPRVAYSNMVYQAYHNRNGVPVWAGSLHYLGNSDSSQPDPATGGPAWTETLLNYGIANFVNGWSLHAYAEEVDNDAPPEPDVLDQIRSQRQLFVSKGGGHVPFAVTEFGWRTDNQDGQADPLEGDEQYQAGRLVDAFQAIGGLDYVTHALAFKLRDFTGDNQYAQGRGVLKENFDEKCAYGELRDLFLLGDTSVQCP